jgi:hypothetical protein
MGQGFKNRKISRRSSIVKAAQRPLATTPLTSLSAHFAIGEPGAIVIKVRNDITGLKVGWDSSSGDSG